MEEREDKRRRTDRPREENQEEKGRRISTNAGRTGEPVKIYSTYINLIRAYIPVMIYVASVYMYTVCSLLQKQNSFPSMDGNGAPKSVDFVDVW